MTESSDDRGSSGRDELGDSAPARPPPRESRGGIRALWNALVGEGNVDESVDDVAVFLGYNSDNESSKSRTVIPSSQANDLAVAYQAVVEAAQAGGLTIRIRVTTPDVRSRERVAELLAELDTEKLARARLENAEAVVEEAEKRMKAAETEAAALRHRNSSLLSELQDLERMARAASSSKDVMIRQLEAALSKAERRLQALAQQQALGPFETHPGAIDRVKNPRHDYASANIATTRSMPNQPTDAPSSGNARSSKSTPDRVETALNAPGTRHKQDTAIQPQSAPLMPHDSQEIQSSAKGAGHPDRSTRRKARDSKSSRIFDDSHDDVHDAMSSQGLTLV